MSIFAVSLNSSPARCGRPPTPAEAKLSLPGCALASATSSAMFLAGTLLATTSISGTFATSVTGAQILGDVVGDLFHGGADGERARAHDPDGVAVGRGFRDHIGAEHAGLPAAIVDHDRLLGHLRHALADHARDDVVGAAGRKRHDQPDRLGRENPPPRPTPATAAATIRSARRSHATSNLSCRPSSLPAPHGAGFHASHASSEHSFETKPA